MYLCSDDKFIKIRKQIALDAGTNVCFYFGMQKNAAGSRHHTDRSLVQFTQLETVVVLKIFVQTGYFLNDSIDLPVVKVHE
jgi:hypothetical protein